MLNLEQPVQVLWTGLKVHCVCESKAKQVAMSAPLVCSDVDHDR